MRKTSSVSGPINWRIKKNHSQSVQFVLLDRLGQPTIDNPVDIKRWMDCMLLLNQQVHG
jgi:hypothetical protein